MYRAKKDLINWNKSELFETFIRRKKVKKRRNC